MQTTVQQRVAWSKVASSGKSLDRALLRHRDVLALLSDVVELQQLVEYLQRRASLTAEDVAKLGESHDA